MSQGSTQMLTKLRIPARGTAVDKSGRKSYKKLRPMSTMTEGQLKIAIDMMEKDKINFSKSNVHINFWCGEISKYLGVTKFIKEFRPEITESNSFFFGDAPNDESMFELFHNSVGVSNIQHCLDRLNHKPRIILEIGRAHV
jgi:hydroxymethylpyrimidine pyrophosphatase-like HAD family hydrolase